MLKVRVIPTLLWKTFGLVKGVGFDSWRRVGPVLPAIRVYDKRDVDELVLLNISATREGEEPDFESVAEYSQECSVPLAVGGGICELSQIRDLLRAGADKVCINSAAYSKPTLIDEAAKKYGSQCIVASIDARRMDDRNYVCFSHCGSEATSRRPVEWALELESRGVGEILITSIDRDGTMSGYDLELISSIGNTVRVPVIASGGAGSYEHMRQAVQEAGASAVAAASIFHFTEQTPRGAKDALERAGVPVRRSYLNPSSTSAI